ncbi:uncharacterized protein LOC127841687 [Dreissena polymorpha]|uniref:B box-type domain-containing protein n=1 Tax=Dreissena polymorpha TaxID=45954 RepID=A0A9D4EUM4_DREPO|nr:uncharacterized protein LOC127841687 [Dreissena polymorpha]XP_052226707.1 uncharacterized protein LOC127841687 [Dreissena polymorpha]XP_052226708.1 uncharacterized protein LOC127841687 [Dreissena polymorpha]KAH3784350.1 hypothetical protein DPMN_162304 [Dreissena polymorpha]
MATSDISRNYDVFKYYCCTICETERSVEIDADFYCKKCLKYFCRTCINSHRQHGWWSYKKYPYGKDKIRKWPLSKKMETFVLKCIIHNDEQLTRYCADHSQLCCSKCVELNHSQCSKVTPIHELTNTQPTDLQGLSVELETVLGEIKSLQISQEASVESLQKTYKEHRADMIEQMRGNVNTNLDKCGYNYVGTSGKIEQYLEDDMCRSVLSILNEFDNITLKELNEMKDEVISIKGSVTSSIHKCTSLHSDLLQLLEIVQKIGDNKELCLIASIKCKHIIQQALTLLGNSGKVFKVQGKSEHNVRITSDSNTCWIPAICALPDGQVLVADYNNNKVKLLNQQYQVVSHWDVNARSFDICLITPREVAVAVSNGIIHAVQFITVNQGKLVSGRKFQLQHECRGIGHHQGDLFVTSGQELYKYTLSGKLICRLYEDRSLKYTVYKCAVSPTGDKLYITSRDQNKLLTLARDGTLLATFTDPALEWPRGLHVTPAGQVLVCGHWPHTVLQVGWEGESKLATLATREDGVWGPRSVCYSSTTSSIIVGQCDDNILVFRVE